MVNYFTLFPYLVYYFTHFKKIVMKILEILGQNFVSPQRRISSLKQQNFRHVLVSVAILLFCIVGNLWLIPVTEFKIIDDFEATGCLTGTKQDREAKKFLELSNIVIFYFIPFAVTLGFNAAMLYRLFRPVSSLDSILRQGQQTKMSPILHHKARMGLIHHHKARMGLISGQKANIGLIHHHKARMGLINGQKIKMGLINGQKAKKGPIHGQQSKVVVSPRLRSYLTRRIRSNLIAVITLTTCDMRL